MMTGCRSRLSSMFSEVSAPRGLATAFGVASSSVRHWRNRFRTGAAVADGGSGFGRAQGECADDCREGTRRDGGGSCEPDVPWLRAGIKRHAGPIWASPYRESHEKQP